MASLKELLTEEGFSENKKLIRNQKKVKLKSRNSLEETNLLPFLICNSQRSFPTQKHDNKTNTIASSCNGSSRRGRGGVGTETESGRSISSGLGLGLAGKSESSSTVDEVASKAVVSILSGYVGQYLRNKEFRETINLKCYYSCFQRKNKDCLDNEGIFANLESGIERIERLAEDQGLKDSESVEYSIRALNFVVASLKNSEKGSTCGVRNSHLSACAQLYLSILYRIEKNGRLSARHLLQVFLDAPFLARMHFLPELWEHLFLPNLLHLKIWYSEQLDYFVLESNHIDKDMKVKALEKAYHAQMDFGTKMFALYYKEWLEVGAHAPTAPHVPLPVVVKQNCTRPRRYSDSSFAHSSNEFL